MLGALTFAMADAGIFKLSGISDNEESQLGLLEIPFGSQISSLDGQHRREALIPAAREISELQNESVAILIYGGDNLESRRRMFSDMNSKYKKVIEALNILFDRQDPYAKAAKELAEKHTLLVDNVEKIAGSIRGDSNIFYTLSGVKDTLKNLK